VEAAGAFEQACRMRPDDYQAASFLSQTYEGLGRKAEAAATHQRALQLVEKHVELNPDDPRALCLGALELAHVGQRERGLEWMRRALSIDPEDSGMLYNAACFYAVQGERDAAFASLEKSVRLGFGLRGWIETDSDLATLRDDPRYHAILQQV
jgi:tetratricopeptide (TPR) repeat protein